MEKERIKGKAISWKGIQKGDKLNGVKKLLKNFKSTEELPKLPESDKTMLDRVMQFITELGVVPAMDGRNVNLANPDSWEGQPPSVRQRALHLITQKIGDNPANRDNDPARYPFVPAIPLTLRYPDLIAKGKHNGQDRIYYFKNYAAGTHLVITNKNGDVLEQGECDGLLSQYSPNLNNTFDNSFKITYKKEKGDVSIASS